MVFMKQSLFDTQALRTLAAVVDAGGFTAAATGLCKTQAAVSATIAALERAAGCRLLERSRRGCRPTPAGEVVVGYARRILGLLDEAAEALETARPAGTLRLGVPDEGVAGLVASVVEGLARDCPEGLVDLRCDLSAGLEAALLAGELDAAVVVREPGSARGELVFRDRLVWCVPSGREPHLVRPLPVGLFAEGCRTRPMILTALAGAGIAWREACRASHIAGLTAMAGRGLAVVALARRTVPQGWRVLAPGEGGLPVLPDYEAALLLPPNPTSLARRLAGLLLGPSDRPERAVLPKAPFLP